MLTSAEIVERDSSVQQLRDFTTVQRISQQLTPFQMMRARLSLEPALAREAAGNASMRL